MSKISSDLLASSIEKVLALSKGEEVDGKKGKVRKFVETIELQVTLRNYDPNKDKRFNGAVRMPSAPRGDRMTICVFGTEEHIGQAKALNIDSLVSRTHWTTTRRRAQPQLASSR
jgi:large subunit ribosomal protein L10Ae